MNEEFKPEYPGDNPNRKWVRDNLRRKGASVDYGDVILRMSSAHVRWLFGQMVTANTAWPGAQY